jgi:predicted amidohydrolase
MPSPRTLAAAQTVPVRGDVEANLAEHVRLARMAAEQRAEVLVFPELSLTGYEIELAAALAFEERDARLEPLREAAAAHGMTVIAGVPARLDSRLHIGAFILSPDGGIALYTKQRMGAFSEAAGVDGIVPPAEATVFQPGDANPLVLFGGHTAAVAVCADIGRPSHAQAAAERGATTYLASMFVIPSEFEGDAAKLQSYAVRHSMAVVLANYGGPTGGLAAAGRSSIWSATGELLVQLGTSGSGVAVAYVP